MVGKLQASTDLIRKNIKKNVAFKSNPLAVDAFTYYFSADNVTITQFLEQENIEFNKPTICLFNGEAIMRKDWDKKVVFDHNHLVFLELPAGGGGGGKSITNVIVAIAVVAAVYFTGGLAAAVASGWAATATTAGVMVFSATMAVMNLINPPEIDTGGRIGGSASSTYSLQAQGNVASLEEPIPSLYGSHQVFPKFAAKPYAEYINDDQFLYQVFTIGQGEYDFSLDDIYIEDSPISSFKEITTEIVPPGGNLTLVNPGVSTSEEVAGQELHQDEYVGPFVAVPRDSVADSLGVDIIFPRGFYKRSIIDWQVEAMQIDDEDQQIGNWIILGNESVDSDQKEPVRKTYNYQLQTPGRYMVRIKRTDEERHLSDSSYTDIAQWGGLKAYLQHSFNPGQTTLLAMKMQATDNLSSRASRKVNVFATRKLKTWHPDTGWSEEATPTRSIAWAIADVLKASYGATLSDNRIDLETLYKLNNIWEQEGSYFDAVFDSKETVWEAVAKIAMCGRTTVYQQRGQVRFVRDDIRSMPTQMFTTRNIVENSFTIKYVTPTEDSADAVKVKFHNRKTWTPDEVTMAVDGSAQNKVATISLFGCTEKTQAERIALYQAASNKYRRQIISFKTELEGLACSYGDLIRISHDMPRWGNAGDVISYDEDRLEITTSINLELDAGETYSAVFRSATGEPSQPVDITPTEKPNVFILSSAPEAQVEIGETSIPFMMYTGQEKERTHVMIDKKDQINRFAIVLAIEPEGSTVTITATNYDERVYTAVAAS